MLLLFFVLRLPQGELVARYPLHVIGIGLLVIGFCILGLVRFKLETEPQKLWVGPTSRAAQDKAAYEASFGPFYRVAQLIVSTTPASVSKYQAPSGLPAVVTDANLQLMFAMQAEVDAIVGEGCWAGVG
jgi:Niemann-Pick C1 protein